MTRMQARAILQMNRLDLLPAAALLAAIAYNAWRWRRDQVAAEGFRSRSPAGSSSTAPVPRLSILVAAWNEAGNLDRHVRSVLSLSFPDRQLVLCAGGTDGTYERALRYAGPDVTVLRQVEGEGKQSALRHCLEAAEGDIVILTDADCFVDDL